MKILLITSFGPALINFRWRLIADLVDLGHHLVVAAPGIKSKVRSKLEGIDVDVRETPMKRTGLNPVEDLAYFFRLIRLIRSTRPDIVLSFTIKPNIWGAFSAALVGIPSVAVLTGLGYAFTQSTSVKQKMTGKLATILYRLATHFNQRVVFQNPDDREDFIASGALSDRSKTSLINGSGVDLSHYERVPLPQDAVFLMISRLLGNKGVREYAAATSLVKQQFPNARFLLVGDWDEGHDAITHKEMETWVCHGLEYLGPVVDVREALKTASVYVLPSYREGTPRSVLEAMSMGRPIITTDAPGCRETVEHGQNGYLVLPRDSGDLAQKMVSLARDHVLRETFGRRSHAIVKDKYDVVKVNRDLIDILEQSV